MTKRYHQNHRCHYDRGYQYTLGRRDAHWKADRRQRRARYLLRVLRRLAPSLIVGSVLPLLILTVKLSLVLGFGAGEVLLVSGILAGILLAVVVKYSEWFFS